MGQTRLEVFLEDCSANGTVVNGAIRLRKGEKRLLNTGDEIALISANSLKGVRSHMEKEMLVKKYSFTFINIYQQRAPMSFPSEALFGSKSTNANGVCKKKQQQGESDSGGCGGERRQERGALQGEWKSPPPKPPPTSSAPEASSSASTNDTTTTASTRESSSSSTSATIGTTTTTATTTTKSSNLKSPFRSGRGSSSSSPPPHQFHPPQPKGPGASRPRPPPGSGRNMKQPSIHEWYDIRQVVGNGTCGEVRLAINRQTGKSCAVKVIGIKKFQSPMTPGLSLADLKQEAEMLQSLDHPYIVKLEDVFTSENAIYLVMEYMQGGDLFDRVVLRGRYGEVRLDEGRRTAGRRAGAKRQQIRHEG